MEKYYNFKQKYEKKKSSAITKIYSKSKKTLEKKRIDAKKYIPPCINCKRKVGSIFLNDNKIYTIKCGDTDEPCDLDYSATRDLTVNLEDIVNSREKYIDTIRESIIRTKLDFLFKYTDEESTLSKFNKQKVELNIENQHLHERKEELSKRLNINGRIQTSLVDNNVLNETFKQIRENSTEFKKSGDINFLSENALLTKDILMPLLKQIRETKYDVSKIESYERNNHTFYKMYNVKHDIKNLEEKIIQSTPKSAKDDANDDD
jgi:hypothetical protein